MTQPHQASKPIPGAVWIVSIFILIAVATAMISLRNQSSIPEPTPEPQISWEIPHPDTDAMEPQVAELIDETRDALMNNQQSAEAWGKYGMILDAHLSNESAAICYRRACELAPTEFRWPYLLAITLAHDQSTFTKSVEWFKKAARLDSHYAPLFLRMGDLQFRQGLTTKAQTSFQQALKINPESATAHRILGRILILKGDPAKAVTHLEQATKLTPDDSTTYASLVTAYTQLKLYDRAEQAMQQSKNLTPQSFFDDAIHYEVGQLGISSVACLMRADQFMMEGDYPSAIEEYLIAANARPYDATVHLDLAKTYRLIRDSENVSYHLSRAVEIQDDLVGIHVVLGGMNTTQQDFDQAIYHYRRATVHAPDKPSFHAKLAGALARNGDFEEALDVFARASELGPLDAIAYTDWGTTLLSTGDFISAMNRFEQAIELDPDRVASHAGLGAAYEQLGQFDEAIAEYEITLSLNPQHAAKDRLDRLRANQSNNTP